MNEQKNNMPLDDLIRETFSADVPPEVAAGMRDQFQAFRQKHIKPASNSRFQFIPFLLTHRVAVGVAAIFCCMVLVGTFLPRQIANQSQPLQSSYFIAAVYQPKAKSSFRCEGIFYEDETRTKWTERRLIVKTNGGYCKIIAYNQDKSAPAKREKPENG